jgi:hypothetical protein
MKRFLGKHNKGFSFVEILCAVAIMSLVSITVGTVIVVSARTYRSGVSETTVQQEAQLAANTIGNVIKDASKVVYCEEGIGKLEDGVKVEDYTGSTILTVATNQNKQYVFTYYSTDKEIKYMEIASGATSGTEQLLASNISSFRANTTNFADTRSITVDMEVTDEGTGRSIPLSYTMNSRNELAGDVTYTAAGDAPVIIFLDDMACIVPGQGEGGTDRYQIPVYVSGNIDEAQLEATYTTNDGKLHIGAVTKTYVEVYVNKSDYASCQGSYKLTLQTKATNADNTPLASSTCTVYIRSVTNITNTYSVDVSGTSNQSRESKNAVYKFTAGVQGYNLTKFNRDFDLHYQDAYAVYWSYELTAGGTTYTYDSSQSESPYSDQSGAEKYIKVTASSTSDTTRPTFALELMDDMPSDFSLKVTATSKHSKGVNKAGSSYATVSGEATVAKIYDSFEVTLEPNETQEFDLGDMIKSAITASSNITFKYFTANDDNDYYRSYTPATGTTAKYIKSTNKVAISIGNEEIGNGYNIGDEPYTFYIGIYVDNKLASRIKVHVRRIDFLHIKIEDSGSDVYSGDGTVYHFKVRYNATTDGQNDMIIKYLINTENETDLKNALSVQLSWAIKDETAADTIADSDLKANNANGNGYSVKLTATIDKVTVKSGWSMTSGIKDNQDYIKTTLKSISEKTYECKIDGAKYLAYVKQPMVRIYYEDDAQTKVLGYSMVQPAEIDIRLRDATNSALPVTSCKHNDAGTPNLSSLGTAIGLSKGKKLVVKAVALHPYKDYNRGHEDYVLDEEYITDVYVLSQKNVSTGNSTVTDATGFMRGNDNFVFTGGWESRNGTYITDKYPEGIAGTQRTVFRYREVNDDGSTGAWSSYYDTEEQGLAIKFNGNNHESALFRPDKSYDVEFANFVYTGTTSNMTLIWPYNDTFRSLIGVKAENTSWNEISKETSWDEFAKTFRIGKVKVTKSDAFGSTSNYTKVEKGGNDIYIDFSMENIDLGHFQNAFKFKVEKLVDGEWVKVSGEGKDVYVSQFGNSIEVKRNGDGMALFISQNAASNIETGKYRAKIELVSEEPDGKFYEIQGTTFKWTTKIASVQFEIGTVYFEIP